MKSTLKQIASEMRNEADMLQRGKPILNFVDAINYMPQMSKRTIRIKEVLYQLQLSRFAIAEMHVYHLSLSNETGDAKSIPKDVVDEITGAFLKKPVPFPSILGNCLQFMEFFSKPMN